MSVPETSELQAFVSIADAGSISAASEELGLPRATLSRRLARLEERLGERLMQRTTRMLRLTDAGAELHRHARAILTAVDVATVAVRRDDAIPRGLLRVSVPPLSTERVRALLLDFMVLYPEIELEVSSSTRHEDLIAENIDVAWRAGEHIDDGLIARHLMHSELIAVAAPSYLERRGTPTGIKELSTHSCLIGFAQGARPATHWPVRTGGRVRVKGRLVCNEPRMLVDAAERGFGIALVPYSFVTPHLEEARLVQVLAQEVGATTRVALVYPNRRQLKPAVRAFVDFIAENWRVALNLEDAGSQPD